MRLIQSELAFAKSIGHSHGMGKKWRIGAVILLAVLVGGGVLWALLQPREPLYDGKPVDYWLRRIIWTTTELPKVDSNAVPVLIKALHKKDGTAHRVYAFVYYISPTWTKMRLPMPQPDSVIRMRAVDWLGELGPRARPAIPALIQVIQNDTNLSVRLKVPRALAAIDINDPAARAALIEASKDKDLSVRMEALQILKPMKDYDTPILP